MSEKAQQTHCESDPGASMAVARRSPGSGADGSRRPPDFRPYWRTVVDVTRDAFIVALRVCAPFVVYSIVINVSTSLINRMSPQIAIYLIAMPFSIAGGLFVLYLTFKPMLTSVIGSLGRVVLLD